MPPLVAWFFVYLLKELGSYQRRGDGFQFVMHLAEIKSAVVPCDIPGDPQTAGKTPVNRAQMVAVMVQSLLAMTPQPDGLFVTDDHLPVLVSTEFRNHAVEPGSSNCDANSRGHQPRIDPR